MTTLYDGSGLSALLLCGIIGAQSIGLFLARTRRLEREYALLSLERNVSPPGVVHSKSELIIWVAYFDPKSESREQRAQRLEREKVDKSVTNGHATNGDAKSHENTNGNGATVNGGGKSE